MTEAELQRLVADACAALRIAHYHCHDSRRSEPGFPDSVMVGTGILYRELKSAAGELRPDQRRWGSRLERAGGDWCVWRPRDWDDGTIMWQLAAIAPGARRATPST